MSCNMSEDMRNYIKPGDMLQIQRDIVDLMERSDVAYARIKSPTKKLLNTCPVCGSKNCEKKIKYANNVYVHQEDVDAADEIERPA